MNGWFVGDGARGGKYFGSFVRGHFHLPTPCLHWRFLVTMFGGGRLAEETLPRSGNDGRAFEMIKMLSRKGIFMWPTL